MMINDDIRQMQKYSECSLDDKQNKEFLAKLNDFHDVFSLRDEVHLKLKDKTPFFVRPYPMREEQ